MWQPNEHSPQEDESPSGDGQQNRGQSRKNSTDARLTWTGRCSCSLFFARLGCGSDT